MMRCSFEAVRRLVFAVVVAATVPTIGLVIAPATASGDASARQAASTVVYPGLGVRVWRASGQLGRLSQTSPGFRHLIAADLDRVWAQWLDRDPDCAQAPIIVVKEYRPRVAFANDLGASSGGPGNAPEKCARGGAYQFYVKRDGAWRAAFGGQDIVSCRALRHWAIPRMSGAKRCWNGHEVVRWDP